MNFNQVILIGNAVDAAKVHKPKGKTPYTDFILAVNRSREGADFVPIRTFNKLADTAAKITKGQAVFVEGRLNISEYKAKDGTPKKSGRVVANWLILL